MDIPYEKMPVTEPPSTSSAILIDGPIHIHQAPVRIRHYFVFSLFSALCLCPATGLVALAYSLKSSAKADVKFHDKARLYSRRALLWNILSVISAVVTLVVALILCYYLNEMMRVYGNRFDRMHQNQFNRMYQNPRPSDATAELNRLMQSLVNNVNKKIKGSSTFDHDQTLTFFPFHPGFLVLSALLYRSLFFSSDMDEHACD